MKEDNSYKIPYIDSKGILSKSNFSQNFASSQVCCNFFEILLCVSILITAIFSTAGWLA